MKKNNHTANDVDEYLLGWIECELNPRLIEIKKVLDALNSIKVTTYNELCLINEKKDELTKEKIRIENEIKSILGTGGAVETQKESILQRMKRQIQEIAHELWDKNPHYTQRDIAISDEVNTFLAKEGKNYTERTLEKWLREVDPRAPNKRRGRPRVK